MTSERYPDNQMMFAHPLDEQYRRFAEIREEICLDYTYNTARAYWGDLDDIFRWAVERGKAPLALTERDWVQYRALLRRRAYSASTVRRRRVSWCSLLRATKRADDSEDKCLSPLQYSASWRQHAVDTEKVV